MKTETELTHPCPTSLRLFVCVYEFSGGTWRTLVEAKSVAEARRKFKRENPHVELKECF